MEGLLVELGLLCLVIVLNTSVLAQLLSRSFSFLLLALVLFV